MSALIELFQASTALYGGNAAFLEDLYERYLQDPESVALAWRTRFEAIRGEAADEVPHGPVRQNFLRLAQESRGRALARSTERLEPAAAQKQAAVLRLINGYRFRGHQIAELDPLRLREPPDIPDLDPAYYELEASDLDQVFHTGSLYAPDRMRLRDIIALVREAYCGTLGAEYMHITSTREKRWIQKRIEGHRARPELAAADRRWLLTMLTAAEGIEKYLHTRYVGQKRFSLEGGEALIPLLDDLIQRAGRKGVKEIVIGMAHRGRLNVLTNILGKPPQDIFDEFEGRPLPARQELAGDVKYHLGFSTDIDTPGGAVHLALGFNPSHLEIIDPVMEGSVRARQHRRGDHAGDQVLPLLIHGDSAFAGQGVIMETLNLSQTRGFSTGGTLHVVVNNQIGFTTSNPLDTRSTLHCTDVAKMVQAPVLHVNGDDPEAVIFTTRLALDYRNEFHKDVIIDLVCYRRLGHNEADEPAVTQPMMYKKIRAHPTPRALYADRLVDAGLLSREAAAAMIEDYRTSIEQGVVVARPVMCGLDNAFRVDWKSCPGVPWDQPTNTGVARAKLQALAERLLRVPPRFELHPRVSKLWNERRKMAHGDQLADWGFAENLAYATLVDAGYPVRLSGQDCGRGTFFHRHAVIHDQATGEGYTPLQHLGEHQGDFVVIDSILSEEAVLGYEYGYATAEPDALTLWEAQFGDFANGAQVVIDQFITSAGTKWDLCCSLVLLLPHGMEGQGAEHSSARLERFLQLCAELNIQVCVPTSPAQIFHLLRRQMLRAYRKPLIVMTPKSLLRHRLATSSLDELADGRFRPVIGETDAIDPAQVARVVLCSGKVYYDLLEARRGRGRDDLAILRLEQLYPFPDKQLRADLAPYTAAGQFIWCQEEPQNQGAWDQIKHRLGQLLPTAGQLFYVGRPASAAPAVGLRAVHVEQQERLIDEALTGRINPNMNRRIPPMSSEVRVPALPESVADATVLTWYKQPGEAVRREENLVDLETDKVVLEVPAPVAGVLGNIEAPVGKIVQADTLLALIQEDTAAEPAPAAIPAADTLAEPAPTPVPTAPTEAAEPLLAPAARRLTKALNLDPTEIPGSGKDGRVHKTDVTAFLEAREPAQPQPPQPPPQPPAAEPNPTDPTAPAGEQPRLTGEAGRPEQRVAMTRLRARVAERLVQAQQTAAILTTFNEVNLNAVIGLRNRYKESFEQTHGVRLGLMAFFVKAAVEALQRFPILNASVDGSDIIYHGYYDIGIAVSSPRGLVVPILRNCDRLAMADIEQGILEFGRKAKDGSLSYEELTGGTFSITNGGVFGSLLSTPILNPPQSAILGLHKLQDRPVAEQGQVVIRPMMNLALSYDHRIIDGRDAVQFLVAIKDTLEDPARLLLRI